MGCWLAVASKIPASRGKVWAERLKTCVQEGGSQAQPCRGTGLGTAGCRSARAGVSSEVASDASHPPTHRLTLWGVFSQKPN